jgi:hypothetical protein
MIEEKQRLRRSLVGIGCDPVIGRQPSGVLVRSAEK